jgi:hypothetical protein
LWANEMLMRVDASSVTYDLRSSHLQLVAFGGVAVRSFALCAHLDLCLRTPRTFRPLAKYFLVCEGIVSQNFSATYKTLSDV